MSKYKKNTKQLNTLGKREKLTEAPDDLGFLTDDEIEEQERQEFEKRLAQRKAQRDTAKSKELDRQEQEKKKEQARKEAEARGKELYEQVKNLPFEDWFDILVPRSGEAPTVAGEIVRAVNRIDYRFWNDGDMFYEGYGRETCGSSAAYLYEFEPFYELLTDMVEMNGRAYEQALTKLCDIAQDYLLDTPELFGTINEQDSRSDREYDINAISEFDEPRDYEYTIYLDDYYWTDPYGEDIYLKDYINNEKCTIWKVQETFEDFYFDDRTGFYIERPWSHYDTKLELSNMDKHSYETVEEYAEDVHLFDELIEELYDEYGDPNAEEDEYEDEEESLKEDTVKQGNKWVNKGNTGKTHGEFKTKKQANAQRKAMFVNKKKNSNWGK